MRCGTRWLPGTRLGGAACRAARRMLLGRGEGTTLRRWLSAVPAESVKRRPRLYLAQAIGAAMSFQMDALGALLDEAERAYAVSGDQPYEAPPGQGASLLANVPAGIAFLRAVLARLRGDARSRPTTTSRPLPKWRGRLVAALLRALEPGGGRLAGRQARASRARPGGGARRAAGGRRVLRWLSRHARLLRPGPCAARPGPPGRGTGDYRQALEPAARTASRPIWAWPT
jgi:hypothetical protein